MRTRTVALIYIAITLFVFVGVYLSESATNQIQGLGRSPQVISLVSREDGCVRVQILGQMWILDLVGMREQLHAGITQSRDQFWQRMVEIMAR